MDIPPSICKYEPASPAYGVYISQLIRYGRACSNYEDFIARGQLLTTRLRHQGYTTPRLKSTFRKFFGRQHDIVGLYEKSASATFDESEIVKLTTPSGVEMTLAQIEDMIWDANFLKSGIIPDFRENLNKIKNMECRADDVFISAYMKAGTHWVWEICSMLVKGKAEYEKIPKEDAMLECHWPEEFESRPSPRILNTHLVYQHLPEQVQKNKSRLIFIQRNPKDVCVSLHCNLQSIPIIDERSKCPFSDSVKGFLTFGIPRNWFDYTLKWESALEANKDNKILCLYYEDLKKNLKSQIRRLAYFLHVKCSEALCSDIADKCNFKNLKKANEEIKKSEHGTPNPEMGDNWKNMYRKGEIGDWKNWFTVADNEMFDNVFADRMKNSQFTYTFE